jgi:hypothetical protein
VGNLSIVRKTDANEYRLKKILPSTKPNYLFQEGFNEKCVKVFQDRQIAEIAMFYLQLNDFEKP